jgi:hypothetical protein
MSADLKAVSGVDTPFPLAPGRGDEAAHGGNGPDNRERTSLQVQPRDIYILHPRPHIDTLKGEGEAFQVDSCMKI